jgi:hypothetical protein
LGACLPNVRKIDTEDVSESQVNAILINFTNLKELKICVTKDLKDTLKCINEYGSNLTRITLSVDSEYSEEFIRENLKDRQGLLAYWSSRKSINEIKI